MDPPFSRPYARCNMDPLFQNFQNGAKRRGLRCVFLSSTNESQVLCKTRLESRMKRFNPDLIVNAVAGR